MEYDPLLVPIMNEHGKYRVPVWVYVTEGRYSVCIGDSTYRHYTESTVPPQIKGLLAMVRAFPKKERTALNYDSPPAPGPQCYFPLDPRLVDIGWQIGEDSYVLVLDRDLLDSMKR